MAALKALINFTAILHIVATAAAAAVGESESFKYINSDDVKKMEKAMSDRGPGYGTDWIMIPDGEGTPQVALLKHEASTKFFQLFEEESAVRGSAKPDEEPYTINPSDDIKFRLFTRSDPKTGREISVSDPATLKSANFNGKKPTKIIIHGWKSSGDSKIVTNIRDAYLSRSDVNVIGVDWSNIAATNYYLTPVGEVPAVGEQLARMIDTVFTTQGARYEDIHIIGHSLGAHVAAIAGARTKGNVSRITGLDPALPGFQYWQGPEGRLDSSDASFVEVIHTCSGALGMSEPVGHVDFYPNGGSPFQPGCCCLAEFTEACSHGRAYEYFAESINAQGEQEFMAAPCYTWDDFKSGLCGADSVPMGELTPPTTRGVYYLLTNSTAPYALGSMGSKYFEEEA